MINYCINILYKHNKYTSCTIQVTEIFLLDYGTPRSNLTGLLIPFIKLNFLHPLKTSQTQNQQTVSMTVLCLQICREDYKPSKVPSSSVDFFWCYIVKCRFQILHTRITHVAICTVNFEHGNLLVTCLISRIDFCKTRFEIKEDCNRLCHFF